MYKPPPRQQRAFGSVIKQAAAHFLMQHGLTLLSRNFSCRSGEIDLIMRDNEVIVFIEVRYRRSLSYGTATATVNRYKQQRIIRTAQFFLSSSRLGDLFPCRFDVVGISPDANSGRLHFDWIKDDFPAH